MPNERLADLMHYVIWRSDPSELGATKLYKICWYSDLEAYRMSGNTISGATHYKRLQHGPVPKNASHVIEHLQQSGKIAVSTENYFDRPKTMYMARTRPAISAFTSDEIAIIDHVAEIICSKHTAASISSLSHDGLWAEIEMGAEIPVAAAAVIPGEITAEDLDWATAVVSSLNANSPPS
jgi:Protein of unknown function (DUF4065)